MPHPYWPLFDLRIETPRLALALPADDDFGELIEAAKLGVHDRDIIPFNTDWTGLPSPQFEEQFAQFHWSQRAEWKPEAWNLVLAVFIDGHPVGLQSIGAKLFAELGTVETGSWLNRPHQGLGFGTEMRTAVLHFAFETLEASEAHSEARLENDSSIGVSRKLGYTDNGLFPAMMGHQPTIVQAFRLTRKQWRADRPDIPVTVTGFESGAHLFRPA